MFIPLHTLCFTLFEFLLQNIWAADMLARVMMHMETFTAALNFESALFTGKANSFFGVVFSFPL